MSDDDIRSTLSQNEEEEHEVDEFTKKRLPKMEEFLNA